MSGVIRAVKPIVDDKDDRKKIYLPIIAVLEDADWDTEDECLGEDDAYDELYVEKYGSDED